jgi:hypothetical protein
VCINVYTNVRQLTSYQIQQCTLFLVVRALLKQTTDVDSSTVETYQLPFLPMNNTSSNTALDFGPNGPAAKANRYEHRLILVGMSAKHGSTYMCNGTVTRQLLIDKRTGGTDHRLFHLLRIVSSMM